MASPTPRLRLHDLAHPNWSGSGPPSPAKAAPPQTYSFDPGLHTITLPGTGRDGQLNPWRTGRGGRGGGRERADPQGEAMGSRDEAKWDPSQTSPLQPPLSLGSWA